MEEALIRECRACGNQISRHSPFCRHCGHPQGKPLALWILGLFLLLMIAFYVAITVYCACHVQQFRIYGPQQERAVEIEQPAQED
jgi:hypothetical protein